MLCEAAGPVEVAVDWCDGVLGQLGNYKVAQHKDSVEHEDTSDAAEQVRLASLVEVVHRERRHDKVEWS